MWLVHFTGDDSRYGSALTDSTQLPMVRTNPKADPRSQDQCEPILKLSDNKRQGRTKRMISAILSITRKGVQNEYKRY